MRLLDVVNFNADASCLAADAWIRALEGGHQSALCRWLDLYATLGKRVSLGFIGATAADVAVLNPEALELVNDHPRVFEIILRPFAHDVSLLRTPSGFQQNVWLGRKVLGRAFRRVTPAYLPPEFMLTSAQVTQLLDHGVETLFINASRFRPGVATRIPDAPHTIEGVLGGRLPCLPLRGTLTRAYLDSFHHWDDSWSRAVLDGPGPLVGSWRDGEGCFFQPDGLRREQTWLQREDPAIERVHVRELLTQLTFSAASAPYPVHSFSDWVKEFRMFGYLRRLHQVEERLDSLSLDEMVIWLLAAGSDVLSAVEKDPPRVLLRSGPQAPQREHVLPRYDRGFEGEEYLAILDGWRSTEVKRFVAESERAHVKKLRARLAYVRECA